MDYYNTLTINQKINCKSTMVYLCGIEFSKLGLLFNFTQRIELICEKLCLEGIIERNFTRVNNERVCF